MSRSKFYSSICFSMACRNFPLNFSSQNNRTFVLTYFQYLISYSQQFLSFTQHLCSNFLTKWKETWAEMLGEWEEMFGKWDKLLEQSENKCSTVLRVILQRKDPAGHRKANTWKKFASGHSLIPSLPLVKFQFLTRVPL